MLGSETLGLTGCGLEAIPAWAIGCSEEELEWRLVPGEARLPRPSPGMLRRTGTGVPALML